MSALYWIKIYIITNKILEINKFMILTENISVLEAASKTACYRTYLICLFSPSHCNVLGATVREQHPICFMVFLLTSLPGSAVGMAPGGAANAACMCSCDLAVSTDRVFSFFWLLMLVWWVV